MELRKFGKAGTHNILTIGMDSSRGMDTACHGKCCVVIAFKPNNVSEIQQAIARGSRGVGIPA